MRLRVDPLTGRPVVIAPGRAARPGAARAEWKPPTQDELDSCPFCAGREDRTPPETLQLPAEGPWRVRVVPNKYPAFDRQEVVVHAPEHVRSLAELDEPQLDLVAEAWRARRQAEPEGYLFACINEGREAGASLPHSHSQLVWFHDTPPAVAGEKQRAVVELVADDTFVVAERDGVVCVAHSSGRVPYELLVAPREVEADAFTSDRLAAALALVADALRRIHAVEGPAPANVWLHDGEHWHLEVLPRLTVLAGLELGAGFYLNPVPPEQAAERLRSVG